MWARVHEYWRRRPGLAWTMRCKQGADASRAAGGRALRAFGQQIKWQQLRYGPIDPACGA